MERVNNWMGLMFIITFLSCGEQTLAPRHYVQWIENPEHGLMVEKDLGVIQYEALYKPIDYIIAMEKRKDHLSRSEIEESRAILGDEMDYFNFRIQAPGQQGNALLTAASSGEEYGQMVNYLSYQMKKDFYLLSDQDTLKCQLYHFTRNFDLAPYLEFALGFEKRPEQDRVFVYDDQVFKTGPVRMMIKNEDIINCPKIKMN